MDLFVYGTLMVPKVMGAVCGYRGAGEPAVLHHHRRRRVRGEDYPGIVACRGDRVEGILYRGLSTRQLALLDAFEGEMYYRRAVQAAAGTRVVQAQSYLIADRFIDRLSDQPWSLDGFLADGLSRFLAAYPGFSTVRHEGGGLDRQ